MRGGMMKGAVSTAYLVNIAMSFILAGCSGMPPADLGVRDGRLAPCPGTPNCVSSQSADREHAIEPLRYSISEAEAIAGLRKIILQMKGARITEEEDGYIRAEFTSAVWRFVDDVEFAFNENLKIIDVRSASRLGHSDFGVNRKRIEEIRVRWQAWGK
jgi:uncharacterized protein (DUF1499 family)